MTEITPETPVVIDPEVLVAARALYRAYAAEDSADAERTASARYDAAAAVYALTPEQAVFMAGQDADEARRTPIVLPRPDATFYGLDFEGGAFDDDDETGWQVVPYSTARNWNCRTQDADSVLFRGAPGVISPVEARRFAAALAAMADAVEAAQAEQGGAR